MITYAPGVPPQNRNLQPIGFLLLNNFTLVSLALAMEPLRMANRLSGRELYRRCTLDLDGHQVWASDGLQITPDAGTDSAPTVNYVIVCGGIGIQCNVTREHVTFPQVQIRQGRHPSAVCTGSRTPARAGLLNGYDCSVHWECLVTMQEAFSRVAMSTRLSSIDHNRLTFSGGTMPMDMMLCLIDREHGRELLAAISEMFIYERIRNRQDHQHVPLEYMLGISQLKLQEIVALMKVNPEESIDPDELTAYVNVSCRQLEWLSQKCLHCSPSRYYLKLRLIRARQLLKQMSMSIIEVASVCDSVSTPYFPRCCREYFGTPPRDEYQDQPLGQLVVLAPILQDPALTSNSSALSALNQAQGESTFASVRI